VLRLMRSFPLAYPFRESPVSPLLFRAHMHVESTAGRNGSRDGNRAGS